MQAADFFGGYEIHLKVYKYPIILFQFNVHLFMLVGISLLFICIVRKHLGYCCLKRLSFKFTIETRRKGKAISLLNFLNLFNTRDQILFFSKIVLEK